MVKKYLFPTTGYGTRLLPATKTMSKERFVMPTNDYCNLRKADGHQ